MLMMLKIYLMMIARIIKEIYNDKKAQFTLYQEGKDVRAKTNY